MPATKTRGRFVWYELMTSDPEAAKRFYSSITGWGTQLFEGAGSPYTMWVNGETPIGGVTELTPEMASQRVPPHWMAHISTDDVDETVAEATELGAKVILPATDIPTVGRFAILADPQGATFAVFKAAQEMGSDSDFAPKVGEASWHELTTTDHVAAFDFYSKLLGWEKTSEMDMGPGGTYQMFGEKANSRPYGGMYNFMPEMPPMPPNWLPYVRVTGLDACVERVRKLGGQVLNGPMEVPGGDRIAQCMDPQGAAFAVHEVAKQG
jgi:predicted enzyme related to lactoylglutathione lyase